MHKITKKSGFFAQGRLASLRGFTLIELLVVISVIGMLSSVVLAALGSTRDSANLAAITSFTSYVYRRFGLDAALIYRFNNNNLTYANDESGNGYNTGAGTLNINTDYISSYNSSGYALKGRACCISSSNFVFANNLDGITVSLWINTSVATLNSVILTAPSRFAVILNQGSNYGLISFNEKTNSTYSYSSKKINDGKWHNITITLNKNGEIIFYTDGKLDTKTNIAAPVFSLYSSTNGLNFLITNVNTDDIMIFNTGLNVAQVEKIYADGLNEHPLALVE